jgi:hypothetical protein
LDARQPFRRTSDEHRIQVHYETCAVKLRKELTHAFGANPSAQTAKGSNWGVMPRIWKDVCAKNPDLFVWIICSRNLDGINDDDLKKFEFVNWWKPLKTYRRTHAYGTDREFLATIDAFLEILRQFRRFTVSTAEIETTGYFPSTYHFRICDFRHPEARSRRKT